MAAGTVSRVFIGVGSGYVKDSEALSAEDIAANVESIRLVDSYTAPGSLQDEIERVVRLASTAV